jgi:NHL repeat
MIAARHLRIAAALLGCAAAGAPAWARAATAGFVHEKSIYLDARRTPLQAPEGVACAEDGRLVVADTGQGRLLTYTWREGQLRGGEATRIPQVPHPVRVELGPGGTMLVLDGKLRRIARLDSKGAFSGYLEIAGASGSAPILPASFKVDASGNVHVLDLAGRRVLAVDGAGKVTRELALPRTGSFTDIAVGASGAVFALDAVGATLWSAGRGAKEFQPLAPSVEDRMKFPSSLVADGRGKLFVVDRHGGAIFVLGEDGSVKGRAMSRGSGDGLLLYPAQLCVTRAEIFVADRNNNRVQVFSILR